MVNSGAKWTGYKSELHHVLTDWPWANHPTSFHRSVPFVNGNKNVPHKVVKIKWVNSHKALRTKPEPNHVLHKCQLLLPHLASIAEKKNTCKGSQWLNFYPEKSNFRPRMGLTHHIILTIFPPSPSSSQPEHFNFYLFYTFQQIVWRELLL